MAKILEMPKLSPTMEEGVLATWHKKEGDPIVVDDLLAEVETDKATMEFRAFDKGTLLKLLVAPGAQVKLGQPVAIVGDAGEDIAALLARAAASLPKAAAPAAPEPAAPAAPPAPPVSSGVPPTLAPPPEVLRMRPTRPAYDVLERTQHDGDPDDAAPVLSGDGRVLASPFVRKAARDRGIDLSGKTGTGKNGRILPGDLDQMSAGSAAGAALARSAAAPALAAPALAAPEVRPLSPMRRTIARRLTESKQNVPHFYLTIDVDAGPLARLRAQLNEGEGDKATKISVNDLIVKAAATALARVPECNAQFSDAGILVHKRVDVSVAVAVPDGLVTPVVRDADKKSLGAIAREIRDLATRARAKKLKPEEMTDGTFSISNLGMFGIDTFAAVINPPEGAILAVGQVRDEPVVEGGAVVAGKRLGMTLSCDHRVVDGAVGAAFLAELRSLLEHPMRILSG
ncbi:MAG: 2-oxo acid dehydrogenase subunit E2 [Myxococcales bacterium]|nr:2-oxo acid dehydrogenase subunit E2 [Myxococcales bacterium]